MTGKPRKCLFLYHYWMHPEFGFMNERIGIFLKDRRKDGVSVPWGEGDTLVGTILQLIRDKEYPTRCYICDYKSDSERTDDVKGCYEFAKADLQQTE